MGRMTRLGVGMPLRMYIDQDSRDARRYVPQIVQAGLGLPDRDYYLVADDAKFKDARASYLAYLTRLLELSRAPGDAAASARAVLGLETALAQGQWARVDTRDPVKAYTRVELAALAPLAPGFDWPAWLAATGLAGKTGDVIVQQPSYLATVAAQLSATPLPVWKAYLRTHLLGSYASFLAKDFVDARFAYVGTTLSGRPRTCRAGSARSASSKRRRANRSASSTSTPTSRRRRRRAWKSSSPTCSPRTATASTRSTG
jgi:predicted metalloendopeptidase